MGEDWQKAVREEVEKLLKAYFIREVRYLTWLANVVLVKKTSWNGVCALTTLTLIKHALKTHIPCQAWISWSIVHLGSNCWASWTPIQGITRSGCTLQTGKNSLHHWRRQFLLQGHALRIEKWRGHVPKAHRPSLQKTERMRLRFTWTTWSSTLTAWPNTW